MPRIDSPTKAFDQRKIDLSASLQSAGYFSVDPRAGTKTAVTASVTSPSLEKLFEAVGAGHSAANLVSLFPPRTYDFLLPGQVYQNIMFTRETASAPSLATYTGNLSWNGSLEPTGGFLWSIINWIPFGPEFNTNVITWQISGLNLSMLDVIAASKTATRSDDAAALRSQLGGDDLFTLSDRPDFANGYGGNDILEGKGGKDKLIGGAGNDALVGGADNDQLLGGRGADFLSGGSGNDILSGDAGKDLLFGDAGNDRLNGGAAADALVGGIGKDTLLGGGGNDILNGGAGNDLLNGRTGNDALQGDAGDDVVNGGPGTDAAIFGGQTAAIVDLRISGYQKTGHGRDKFISIENLIGHDGADKLTGDQGKNEIHGNRNNDRLNGAGNADKLFGDGGRDVLSGDRGNDILAGGPDQDRFLFRKGDGSDTIQDFTSGADRIVIISGANGMGGVTIRDKGSDTLVKFANVEITLTGVDHKQIDSGDFVFV